MRIGIDCHFESKILQGTHTYVSELVAAIARNDKINSYFLLNAEYNGKEYHPESQNIIKKPIKTNSTRKNIIYGFRRIAKGNELDILHTNYLSPFWTPCKKVVTIHDILYLSHKVFFPFFHRLQLRMFTPFTLHKADKIISVSEYTRKEIIRRYRVEPSKVCVILEAASQDFKRINEKDNDSGMQDVKLKYRIHDDFILYVGRFAPIKNIPRMVKVFSEYNKGAMSKMSFVLVGDPDPVYPDKKLLRLLEKGKKDNNVIVLGKVPKSDLVKLYNAAKALFFITYGEGFGLPILEAMACGLPVIISNVTSCSEVAGDAALLVNPNNNREIFEALKSLLNYENLRKRFIEKGLRRAGLFSWDRCARETIKIYRALGEN